MANKNMTHVGTVNHLYLVEFRETDRYWISQNEIKYRKTNGGRVGSDVYSKYSLDLSSIMPIGEIF